MNSNFYADATQYSHDGKKQAQEGHTDLVNGDELLVELVETVKKYIVADEEIIIVVVLWCIMTWCMNTVYYAPILHITSSERQSGKTKLLNILKRLSYEPEIVSSITKAALSRKISDYQNTMLFDKLEKSFLSQKNVVDIFVSGFIKGSGSIAYCSVLSVHEQMQY